MRVQVSAKPTTRNPEATRAILLEAAFKEIYEHGFQSASLERILANTKLTKGALYHHFPNKHALGLAVVQELIEGFHHEGMVQPLLDADNPIEAMLAMLDSGLEQAQPERLAFGCPINNLIQEMSPLDDGFRQHLQRIVELWHTAIATALKQGQQRGQVRQDVDADEAAIFLVAAFEGAASVAKSTQSLHTYTSCLNQLKAFVRSLAV